MKVLWFNGNFGNQIFYCAYKDYLQKKYPQSKIYAYIDPFCPPVKIEERTNLILPDINWLVNILSFFVFKVLGIIYRRIPVNFVPKWYSERGCLDDEATFIGHSMQEKFFYELLNSEWLNIVEPQNQTLQYQKWKQIIIGCNAVCIHIRRGDYVKPGSAYTDLSSTDYYDKAIALAKEWYPSCNLFVFSDDIEFAKTRIKGDKVFFVNCNNGANSYLDILLMSFAKVNIMANSTFSYWAAYMGHEHKKVIYPNQWFCNGRNRPNIMLDKWIGI